MGFLMVVLNKRKTSFFGSTKNLEVSVFTVSYDGITPAILMTGEEADIAEELKRSSRLFFKKV